MRYNGFTASLLLVFYFMASSSLAFTHWLVTENGKIQSETNSLFQMKRPYDLMSLLEQEQRVRLLEALKDKLLKQDLYIIERRLKMLVEYNFFEEDSDCQKAGRPLVEFDLFASSFVQPDIFTLVGDPMRSIDKWRSYGEPLCSIVESAAHSNAEEIYKLTVMSSFEELTIPKDIGLMSIILQNGSFCLKQYGQLVTGALHESDDKMLWVASLLASNYWRITGNASQAIQCIKTALHLAPTDKKFMAYLALANVLHKAQHFEDAVKVLLLALELSPDKVSLHFTLGNVLATMLKFNESAESYNQAMKLQPDFEAAKKQHHAILCHQKLERTLEEQQLALQDTLRELRDYKMQYEEWETLSKKALSEQDSVQTRTESRIFTQKNGWCSLYKTMEVMGRNSVQEYCDVNIDIKDYERFSQSIHGSIEQQEVGHRMAPSFRSPSKSMNKGEATENHLSASEFLYDQGL